jgi:hypothetical protein
MKQTEKTKLTKDQKIIASLPYERRMELLSQRKETLFEMIKQNLFTILL